MATSRLVPLHGSTRDATADARTVRTVDESESIDLTLVLRRRAEIPDGLVEGPRTFSRQELAERFGAVPADIELISRTAREHGLDVTDVDQASRRVRITGTLAELRAVVDPAALTVVESRHPATGRTVEHRRRQGALRILADWQNVVVAVLGMDDRPQARPHIRHIKPAATRISYTPVELEWIYRFPGGTDGAGRTLAVLELGGGFTQEDLDTYFSGLGIVMPTIETVGINGADNTPEGDPHGPDGQVLLDIEVAGALAPRARQVVYFAPNTARGFTDALSTAVHADPTPTAISIGWGLSEVDWTGQGRAVFDAALADAAALGITVCVAAGDNGSSAEEPAIGYPASSPLALACGGTSLDVDPLTGTVRSERMWGRGGFSRIYRQPSWQAHDVMDPVSQHRLGRGIPDVAAVADPSTGYEVLIDGQRLVVGGTGAVAPLWAALACRLSESLGRPLGLLQPLLYAGASPDSTPTGFRDIILGDAGLGRFSSTGLGVPDGTVLAAALGPITSSREDED